MLQLRRRADAVAAANSLCAMQGCCARTSSRNMLSLAGSAALSFAPAAAPAVVSRSAVRMESPVMTEAPSRRELFARAGAALAGLSAVQSASAKAGQFGKVEIFSLIGEPAISSPYQPGGPKAGPDSTYGYAKSEGDFAAKGYQADVTREKKAFEVSSKIISSQGPNVDSKTWWLVRDNLRGQAYEMKSNMRAINKQLTDKKAADAAYAKFWKEVDALDLACQKKELALAQKEYQDVLAALQAYTALI